MTEESSPTEQTNFQGNVTGSAVGGGTVNAHNIAGRDIHEHHYGAREIQYPVANLPLANPHFVGRETHLEMLTAAPAGSATTITQTIAGLGGVGKSQMMLHFAYQQRRQNAYDIIWWLRVDEALAEDLLALGRQLGLAVLGLPQEDGVQLVRSWLNSTDKRWLLLCDNADETEPRRLRHFLPQNPKGRILITSRNPHWQSLGSVLRLDVFTPDEAAAFWREKLGAGDETKRAELAAELGFLPLALEQAAAYMAENSLKAEAYLALYQARRQALWQDTPPPDDYHATITTTWNISFARARQTPGAADLLNLCCFLAPDDIPLALLIDHAEVLPPDLAAVLPDDLARNKALHALTGYSLLTRQDGTVTIHRLVQTVARDQMKTELAQTWVEAAVDLLRKAYRYDPHDMNTWPMCAELLPHLRITTELADEREIHTNHAAFLNNEAGFYLNQNGQYTAARPFYERALAIREQALGPDHPDTAQSLNNLGALHSAMGNLSEARPFYERALAIREQALGSDHPDTARSLNNLGALHRAMGNLSEARPFYERALAINEQALGPDHPDTARSLNNLGYLHRAMGNLSDARPFYERALAITEQALGPDHPDTARSLNNLGSLLQDMGNLSEARPFYERALAIREQALGPDHPDTALSLNNLAVLSYYENDKAEAAHLMQRALIIWEAALGSDHPDTQSSRQSLSIIQSELNS